ncbi:MAG: thiamine pyrophosphate-binding protein [Solirubrobacteraceae bacterium]|jgi:benzoylformate decarboxylase
MLESGQGAPRAQSAAPSTGPGAVRTVREAVLDVLREYGMTKIFGNPGSTEIPFLTDLPADFDYVLGLHEGSLVGIASGYAIGAGRPAFVNLHTAPGLGNAVNAIAGARDNRAPLVILVGQQDRRQLALAPFLTGRSLERLAGDYPVWTETPSRAQDLPGAIARAWHEASQARGPALVVAPMGDWEEPAEAEGAAGAPARVLQAPSFSEEAIAELAALVERSASPALVVGAGIDTRAGWDGAVALAERLNAPVWGQEFGSRAGFPQDHPLFAGHLHWSRRRMRESLAAHDLVIAIGTAAFLLYIYDPGSMVAPAASVIVISDVPEEVNRSSAELALLGPPALACAMLAEQLTQRDGPAPAPRQLLPDPPPPAPGEPLQPGHVFVALRDRLPENVVLMEESPSSRPELMARIPARQPLGFISGANGALGFGISAATGLAMALDDRPVVAVLGDGASLYSIQALWSAARYGAPLLALVMSNHRYAVMDGLAARAGGRGAWPDFAAVDIALLAEGLGCPSRRISEHAELLAALDELLPGLERRDGPMLLVVELGAGS